jgi:hypothetical protein
MIATAVFSFRQFQPFELWRDLLPWTLALAWAREHFPQRVLVADAPGRAMLAGALGLPFTEVLDLPPGPAGCGHVYALAKLQAHLAACDRGEPYLHHDGDARLEKPLAPRLHAAPFVSEFRYSPRPYARQINVKLGRLAAIGTGFSAGVSGGNDLPGIRQWAQRSLDCAHAHAEALGKCNGFQAGTVLEEIAAGAELAEGAEMIVADGSQAEAERAGWYHLASLKRDRAALVQAALTLQFQFPEDYARTMRNWQRAKQNAH